MPGENSRTKKPCSKTKAPPYGRFVNRFAKFHNCSETVVESEDKRLTQISSFFLRTIDKTSNWLFFPFILISKIFRFLGKF